MVFKERQFNEAERYLLDETNSPKDKVENTQIMKLSKGFCTVRLTIFILLFVVTPIRLNAQDVSLQSTYGEVDLVAGFDDDPREVSVSAGGSVNLSESTRINCWGYFSEAPDYKINYSADNKNYTLSFFSTSEKDTVLLVNDPSGAWHCNDDFSDQYGFTPGVEFSSALDGVYDVWVGVYEEDDKYTSATLAITELGFLLNEDTTPAETSSDTPSSTTPKNTGSGTAFVVSNSGHLLTNYHVISGCTSLAFKLTGETAIEATVVSTNERSDLALLRANISTSAAVFQSQSRPRLGDEIVVYGFPLLGALSSQGNLTSGVVSALTGLNDDLSTFQISAQIQHGNSGGPVFDRHGAVVGVVVSMANQEYFAQQSGSIPQNVNFAITASITRSFLDANNIDYSTTNILEELSTADIAEKAQSITGALLCYE